jgi:hypothetical protein
VVVKNEEPKDADEANRLMIENSENLKKQAE